uniref:Uncharacterized protein n=1 Tax=Oryza meridionalis TaxID=40149 RepID=A0A0E0D5F6_9ORYZ
MEDELVNLSFFFRSSSGGALVRQDREKSLRLPGYPVGWSRWLVKHITRFRKNLVHTKISCLPVVTKHNRYIHAMQVTFSLRLCSGGTCDQLSISLKNFVLYI